VSCPPEIHPFPRNVDDWPPYLDRIYERYMESMIRSSPILWGKKVKARYNPDYQGKGFSFWHLISEGPAESERTPDPRRCERIEWVRWAIDCAESDDDCVRRFESQRSGRRGTTTNLVLWAHEVDYAVILEIRAEYYLLVTAYQLVSHRRNSFERDWKRAPK
jgi:hypothetical protein